MTDITHQALNYKQVFKFRQLFSSQKLLWLTSWLLGWVTVWAIIGLLMLSGWFISAAAVAGMLALGSQSFNYLMPAAMIRMLAMARTAGRYGELMVSHEAVFGLLAQLRVQFFRRFATLSPWQLPTHLRSAFTMHRLTHDIDILDEFALRVVSPWWVAMVSSLAMIFLVIYLLTPLHHLQILGWLMAVGLLIATLLVPFISMLKGIGQANRQQLLIEQRRAALIEPLSALTHLILWQCWQDEIQKFYQLAQCFDIEQRCSQNFRGYTMLAMQWLMAVVLLILLFGIGTSDLVDLEQAHLSIPSLLALVLGLLGLTEIILPLAQNYLALGNSIAAKHRLNELLTSTEFTAITAIIEQNQHTLTQLAAPLCLQVQNLSAKHPAAIVGFSAISFEVLQGQPLLITGVSGAGKSTLLQVIAKELLPVSGQILLNNIALTDIDFDHQVGYLAQQIDIFDQTLAQNLRLGKVNATDDELWQVLIKVGLADWVKSQPAQLQTRLGEYGMAVSGGQARRIALARLLLSPKKILLLDEPFAGLDTANQEKLWQMLVKQQQDGILIVVTHHQHDWQGSPHHIHLDEADAI